MSDYGMPDIRFWPKYRIIDRISHGAQGEVYRIQHEDYGESIDALKVIHCTGASDPEKVRSEIAAMVSLKGKKNIVPLYDFYIESDPVNGGCTVYIRMALMETSLQSLVTGETLDEREIVQLGVQICEALKQCEDSHIVHCDIKPANILIDSSDGSYRLGDFGSAVKYKTSGEVPHQETGTPNYLSPEVAAGQRPSAQSDMYALGLILYQLLNDGKLPFVESSDPYDREVCRQANARRYNGDALPLPRRGSPDLQSVILKACAFNPMNRYTAAYQMQRALRQARINEPVDPNETDDLHNDRPDPVPFQTTERLSNPRPAADEPQREPEEAQKRGLIKPKAEKPSAERAKEEKPKKEKRERPKRQRLTAADFEEAPKKRGSKIWLLALIPLALALIGFGVYRLFPEVVDKVKGEDAQPAGFAMTIVTADPAAAPTPTSGDTPVRVSPADGGASSGAVDSGADSMFTPANRQSIAAIVREADGYAAQGDYETALSTVEMAYPNYAQSTSIQGKVKEYRTKLNVGDEVAVTPRAGLPDEDVTPRPTAQTQQAAVVQPTATVQLTAQAQPTATPRPVITAQPKDAAQSYLLEAEIFRCSPGAAMYGTTSMSEAPAAVVPVGETVYILSNTPYMTRDQGGEQHCLAVCQYNGQKGFIDIRYLNPRVTADNPRLQTSADGADKVVVRNEGDIIIYRTQPSSSGSALGLMFYGEVMTYLDNTMGEGGTIWYHCNHLGTDCYISNDDAKRG